MQKLDGFFDKFNNKIAREVNNLLLVVESIKRHTGITIEIKNISLSNGILKIKTSQIQKNEIFIKKTKILKDLEKLNGRVVLDVQ